MAVDLRQVMAAFLTASMFLMLGNMIKRDHIDPLLDNIGGASPNTQYDVMKVSKQSVTELPGTTASTGLWTEAGEKGQHALKPCWKKPSSTYEEEEGSKGYVFFSLSNGPEHHASQIANAVVVAKHLGATLVVPDIRGTKVGDKRNFGEVYDLDKFIASLDGVVPVVKTHPLTDVTTVRVPDRVSSDYITSKIKPIFKTGKNLRIVTYIPSPTTAIAKQTKDETSPYECLATFESLELEKDLKSLANSMVGTLRSLSHKTNGKFVAVDLSVEMLGQTSCQESDSGSIKGCYSAEEIGKFLNKVGFEKDTTIYLTQSGWDTSLNALRDMFPNTFTKDAIMPVNGKARYLDPEGTEVQKAIDLHICTESDVFIPAYSSLFYTNVAGKRIASGKTQILVPAAETTSTSAKDYVSPYISQKNHLAYSCFC